MRQGVVDETVGKAVDGGTAYLLTAQDDDGHWRDYDFLGPSDGWMTAYVGGTLAELDDPTAVSAASRAMDVLLQEQDTNGGWAYNALQPHDADSTGWVLMLANSLGRSPDDQWAVRARDFVSQHVRDDGLVSTYTMELAGPVFERFPDIPSWDGWCAAHECVTAAVASVPQLPERQRILDALLAGQRPTGQWRAYWWVDQELTTALACEALSSVADSGPARARAARWAAERIGADGAVHTELHPGGSPFATAWALRVLLAADDPQEQTARDAATRWLTDHQRPDGSWLPSARLRMPFTWESDADAHVDWTLDGVGRKLLGTIARDTFGLHTTATVVRALALASATRIGER
ncbi:prenyltransferase/squalene oxidase repeat-containing protein [Micromonospora ureilytica]|uniref:prenyltransferase/squalene oxidase repeat-containing protein n=1 Tax=Micromonospora ureilytica TaxID=709868 RepID=UPI0033D21F93